MSLVRPSLEYASAAWSPYTDTDVKRLEQTQKSAARFVCGDYKLTTSTTGLVKGLGWDTLEDRRLFESVSPLLQISPQHCQLQTSC